MNLKHTLLSSGAFGGMTANERRLGRFIRDGEGHPAPTPTPAAEVSADDAFASAFDEHAAETPPAAVPAAAPPAEDPPAAAAPPAAEAGAAGTGGEAPPAGAEAPAPGEQAPAPAAAEKPADLSAEEVLNRLAGMMQKPAEAAPAQPAEQPAEQLPVYSAAEQAQLAEYEKNWPDVAAGESLRRKVEYDALLRFVFGEVAKYVAPVQDQVRALGNTLHLTEVKSLVPDYTENLEADVSSWVDTQPAYLQSAYKQVMQTGTSDEIADLIGRYRAATGAAPATPQAPSAAPTPPAAAPAAAPAAPAKTELSSAAKQAAESLAPVSGDRSAVPQGEDTQDFDSAFARYAATGGS